jgi:hypothetical protein
MHGKKQLMEFNSFQYKLLSKNSNSLLQINLPENPEIPDVKSSHYMAGNSEGPRL